MQDNDMQKLKVLDLFSGIGGFSLGLERTGGFETVAFCEIEKFPQGILKKHWPDVPIYTDVRDLNARQIHSDGIISIDVITGGFPCQDLSVAGKMSGINGHRSGLWSEIIRLTCEIRPKFVVVESVANLLSGPSERRGLWFSRVLGDLAEIGYDAEWEVISASSIGAPHRRSRVWIIAYPKRNEQSREEPCFGSLRRMGGVVKSVSWNEHWEDALAKVRRMDDGLSRSVDRTDTLRNSIVPPIAYLIGRSILSTIGDCHEN